MTIFFLFFFVTAEVIQYWLKCMGRKGRRWCTTYILLNSLFFGFAFLNRLPSWTSSRAGFEEIFHQKAFSENHLVQDLHGLKSLCPHIGYFQHMLEYLGQWGKANIVSLMQELWWRKMPSTSQLFFLSWLSEVNLYHHFLVIRSP